jgi:entericidin A
METQMKKSIATIAILFAGLFLVGCNTIEGVGKDVKKTGETIEKAAKK